MLTRPASACGTPRPKSSKSNASAEKAPSRDVAALDGRCERVVATVRKSMQDLEGAINDVLDFSFYTHEGTAEGESAMDQLLKKRATDAAST